MFRKVSIAVGINKGFETYDRVSIEILLKKNGHQLLINSGYMQTLNTTTTFSTRDVKSYSRNNMLSAIWWKGKNESAICLFEFLDKEYDHFELRTEVLHNSALNNTAGVQPLKEGHYVTDILDYFITISDL